MPKPDTPVPPSLSSHLPPLIAALRVWLDAELIETHVSWVLLSADTAWKIKKPLVLPFLDYGTLARRAAACRAELELNQRLAPGLYLGIRAIGGSPEAPRPDAEPVLEWAVCMRRFDRTQQLDVLCARGELTPAPLDELARHLHAFQRHAAIASPDSGFGTAARVLAPATDNCVDLQRRMPAADQSLIDTLTTWTRTEFQRIEPLLEQRRQEGHVREGHGDLHLGNLVIIDGVVTPFDGIEFNADLRWIDVVSDIAFTWVDLLDHRRPGLAAWFLNAWREASGDTAALRVLRFYAVYRALVRAKVAAIRAGQEEETGAQARDLASARNYLELATQIAHPVASTLTITVGLSGSGKTTASTHALLTCADGGLLRLRSDVERKRLFGLDAASSSGSAIQGGIYTPDANARTYARLQTDTALLLAAGWSVIVDAAFLRRVERETFRQLATQYGASLRILECAAPIDELESRIRARRNDASEATIAVLRQQLAWFEPLTEDERSLCVGAGLSPPRSGFFAADPATRPTLAVQEKTPATP